MVPDAQENDETGSGPVERKSHSEDNDDSWWNGSNDPWWGLHERYQDEQRRDDTPEDYPEAGTDLEYEGATNLK